MGLLQDMQEIASRLPAAMAPKKWPAFDGTMLERNTYLSSSETGSCLRKAYFDRKDKPAFKKNGFADRGHIIEDWLVKQLLPLREQGYGIEYVGDEQRSFYIPEWGISGTPDGLITLPTVGDAPGEKIAIEIKSIDPRTNKTRLPKLNHTYQLQQNMLLLRECLNLDIRRGFLIYIDASNIYDQAEFEIPFDDDIVDMLLARAEKLDGAAAPEQLDPEGMFNDGCEYCQHTMACSETVAGKLAALKANGGGNFFDPESPSGLTKVFVPTAEEVIALQRYTNGKALEKQGEKAAKEEDEFIRKLIADNGGSIYWQGVTLAISVQAGVVTLDKDKVSDLAAKNQMKLTDLQKQGAPFTKMSMKGV